MEPQEADDDQKNQGMEKNLRGISEDLPGMVAEKGLEPEKEVGLIGERPRGDSEGQGEDSQLGGEKGADGQVGEESGQGGDDGCFHVPGCIKGPDDDPDPRKRPQADGVADEGRGRLGGACFVELSMLEEKPDKRFP